MSNTSFPAFWREQPLSDAENEMLMAVFTAHALSARRLNQSSYAVQSGASMAGDYTKAIAGAILTLGAGHGPIADCMGFLEEFEDGEHIADYLLSGRRLPGWGNSFHKGVPDPLWVNVDALTTATHFGKVAAQITAEFHECGKILFPNPACYTAILCLELGIPKEISPFIFLHGRLMEWTRLYLRELQQTKPIWHA